MTPVGDYTTYILLSVAGGLGLLLCRHFLLKERDRISRFNDAADELKKVFNKVLVDIDDFRPNFFYNKNLIADQLNKEKVVFLNFRDFLHGTSRDRYDEAWHIYSYCSLHPMGKHDEIKKAALEILEFTDYKLTRNMKITFQDLFFKIRSRLLASDKEKSKAIKKPEDKIIL